MKVVNLKNLEKSEKLYVRIAKEINNAIIEGDFSPGEKLPPERELASKLGTSRASVREALAVLEILGIVEIKVGNGSFIKKARENFNLELKRIQQSSPFELIEARYLIESIIVELAIDRAQQEHIEILKSNINFLKDNINNEEKIDDFFNYGVQFHREIALITNNDVLIEIQENLLQEDSHPLWKHLNQKALSSKNARLHQIEEHEEILQAIIKKDKEKAKKAMRHHLEHLSELLLD